MFQKYISCGVVNAFFIIKKLALLISALMLVACNEPASTSDTEEESVTGLYTVILNYGHFTDVRKLERDTFLLLPHSPVSGREILKWNNATTGLAYQPGEEVLINRPSMSLSAEWVVRMYRVEYISSVTDTTPVARLYEEGSRINVSSTELVREGYDFLGWYYDGRMYQPNDEVIVESDISFVSKWQLKTQVQLNFDAAGGSGGPTSLTKRVDDNIFLPSQTPSKTGYDFVSWSLSGKNYQPGESYKVTGNVTFVAQWERLVAIEYRYLDGRVVSRYYPTNSYFQPYADAPLAIYHYWYSNVTSTSLGPQLRKDVSTFLDVDTINSLGGSEDLIFYQKGWDSTRTNNWMAGLDDQWLISQVSIPGTHDAVADQGCSGTGIGKTQTESIDEQLRNGVRFLDFRARHYKDTFPMHHGSCYLGTSFGEEIAHVVDFLKDNPSEFVFISMKPEHNASNNTLTYKQVFDRYLSDMNMRDMWHLDNQLLTVEAARGKIILISRTSSLPYGLRVNNWPDNNESTFTSDSGVRFRIQDQYNLGIALGSHANAIEKKQNAIERLLTESAISSENTMTINHSSGYVNSWNIINLLDDDINPWLSTLLFKQSKHVGIISSDYASSGGLLVRQTLKDNIIKQNFR